MTTVNIIGWFFIGYFSIGALSAIVAYATEGKSLGGQWISNGIAVVLIFAFWWFFVLPALWEKLRK